VRRVGVGDVDGLGPPGRFGGLGDLDPARLRGRRSRHTKGRPAADRLRMVEDYPLAVSAYSVCDVVMVNRVADGMNLVAKEVVPVNARDGVLALSETAGAYEELHDHVVPLYPVDVAQMAAALHEALTMPADKRRKRRAAAAEQVRSHDVVAWLAAQLADLAAIRG
jgi:trehalose 6-phosphate synthase